MSLFEDTNPRKLKDLLSQIHSREAALPDFQRDFVWDPNATQELIVSIASNFPAGSLLRIRNTKDLFASREFQGAPSLDGHRVTYLILDGQQRLTSLYQAFSGVGDHRYYLDIHRLLDGTDFDECMIHLKAGEKKARQYENPDVQAQELIMPLSILHDGAAGFGRWSLLVARKQPTDEARIKLEDSLSDLEEKWIQAIDDYLFPVVTLSDSTPAEAVCTIFETLNRTGIKLSVFELLTARFWPKKINLRNLWQKAQDEHPIIADFQVDPYYVLQIVSLASRGTPSCKRTDVLNLDVPAIEKWWEPAVLAVAKALEMLRDDCGVLIPDWLPYNTIVIPLAAILAKAEKSQNSKAGSDRHKITRWFWCSVFGQTYENAPNSQAAKDMVEVLAWLGNDAATPETVKDFRFDPKTLRETTPRQRALYRGGMCLILRNSPRDFHTVAKLTGDLILEHKVDDHHIFPQAYLDPSGVLPRLRDCLLNRTLIDRLTNIRIGKRAPSDYLEEILNDLKPQKFRELLDSHFLPPDKESPFWHNDFEGFLSWREKTLGSRIQEVTGPESAEEASAPANKSE